MQIHRMYNARSQLASSACTTPTAEASRTIASEPHYAPTRTAESADRKGKETARSPDRSPEPASSQDTKPIIIDISDSESSEDGAHVARSFDRASMSVSSEGSSTGDEAVSLDQVTIRNHRKHPLYL